MADICTGFEHQSNNFPLKLKKMRHSNFLVALKVSGLTSKPRPDHFKEGATVGQKN